MARARELARECRERLGQNLDPIVERDRLRDAQRIADARAITFGDCVQAFLAGQEAGWRNAKHRAQWETTLQTYAQPVLGNLPTAQIDTSLVVRVLEPIWRSKTETATRVRQRIEAVLDWAAARGYRAADNPARWKGHLDKLLAHPTRLKRVQHHSALPYKDVAAFMSALRSKDGIAPRALEFCILTAARTNEVTRARWNEIDSNRRIWTIPPERMKAGREHRIPLSAAARKILTQVHGIDDEFIFPSLRVGTPISNMAMLGVRNRMNYEHITVHGFRSSFRDWAAERTSYPSEVVEMALAHSIKDKAEAAYRRGDLFEKRTKLMGHWARYVASPRREK